MSSAGATPDFPDLPSSHPGALTTEYDNSVRPYIDLIDKLRAYNIERDVPLPSIVVVGDQSSGKSSVLEALSGVQLPRGSGMMTRCPLTLKLKSHRAVDKWCGAISYKVTDKRHCFDIDFPESVAQQVEKAQEALAGPKGSKSVTNEMIDLEIQGYGVPDLTLIDLPGIIRTTAKGQRADMPQKIRDMICEHTNKKTTIIMAVLPANQDLETTEGLQMAKMVDPDGERTLGVITKPDRVERGMEEDILALLRGEKYNLKKGFVMVKCRTAEELKTQLSLSDAIENERTFFSQHKLFRTVDSKMMGTESLAKKLVRELVNKIKVYNPELKEKVRTLFDQIKSDLSTMGRQVPESKEARGQFLYKLILDFTDRIQSVGEGSTSKMGNEGKEIFTMARDKYSTFANELRKSIPSQHDKQYVESLKQTIECQRGRELPGFESYAVFSNHIKRIIETFKGPASDCVEEVFEEVRAIFDRIANSMFQMYPQLCADVNGQLHQIYEEIGEQCRREVDKILNIEMLIYTNDKTYETEYNQDKMMIGKRYLSTDGKTVLPNPFKDDARVEETFWKINAYLKVCVRRVIDIIPMTITYYLIDTQANHVRLRIGAMTSSPTACDLLLEDPDVAGKRADLQRRHDNLKKALAELIRF